jgi:excisionase family DNA binding protein
MFPKLDYFQGSERARAMVTNEPLTYSVREVAQLLRLSRNSTYQACVKGEIPSIRIGKRILIPKAQFERLLAGSSEARSGNE